MDLTISDRTRYDVICRARDILSPNEDMKRIKKYSYYLLEYGNRVCKCSTNTLGTFLSNSAPSVAGMILRSIVDTRGTLCNRFVVDDNTIEYETVEDSSESETTIDSDVKEHIRIPSSKQRYSRKNRRKC